MPVADWAWPQRFLSMPRSKRHQRSNRALQRREASRIVSQHAIRDLQIKESINILGPAEIEIHLFDSLGAADPFVAMGYDMGEVLSDSYARGSLQRIGAVID